RPWLCGMMLQFQFNDRVALSSCNRRGKKVYGNVRRTKTDETPVLRELSAMNDLETKTIGNDIPDDVQFRVYCPCTPKRAK
ncbi:hypothetical protein, partial [Pseudomonas helleri]|uniref:hypothetical protein n=1 Tax=Pseudomonas helleri TaxID=1608996 RepID=UPI001E470A77